MGGLDGDTPGCRGQPLLSTFSACSKTSPRKLPSNFVITTSLSCSVILFLFFSRCFCIFFPLTCLFPFYVSFETALRIFVDNPQIRPSTSKLVPPAMLHSRAPHSPRSMDSPCCDIDCMRLANWVPPYFIHLASSCCKKLLVNFSSSSPLSCFFFCIRVFSLSFILAAWFFL